MASKTSPYIIYMSVEIKIPVGGCVWEYTETLQCIQYLIVILDGCNCDGVYYKKGDILENNCLQWRLYPNTVYGGGGVLGFC
jgi:hypothetical protein